ncbi:MAG: response regulator [Candidatus Kapabacteria bacterium]|nr:response regulator [Candidatus Kapabacteria bacterium]
MGKLICIVEDNVPIRKLFCTLLNKAGFETIDFGDGTSAINWINTGKPDLMIIDILLPDMNGTDIMKHARTLPHGNSFPIISSTGFAQASDRDKYLGLGFDFYISKPINSTTFVQEIKQIMDDFAASKK